MSGDETGQTLEQRIRERAYELWDKSGQLGDMAERHWEQARAEIEAELQRERPPE